MTTLDAQPYDLWAGVEGVLDPSGGAGVSNSDTPSRAGWVPVDLTDVLNGTAPVVEPEFGRRHDGVALLYRGKEHSIASEPECGKTWFALMCVHDVLITGGRVAYIDFEDDAPTVVGRLLTLGAVPRRLRPEACQFRYVRPEGRYHGAWFLELLDFGQGNHADLVILDGVTEGMSLFGLDPLKQPDAAVWRQILIKPAVTVGAATLATDHVTKDKESRGGYAIGAQHKLAGLNGVQFLLEQVQPFGRGIKGISRVLVSKDRNGSLRRHGRPTNNPRITYLGDLVGDATSGNMASLIFWPPRDDSEDEGAIPRHIRAHVPKIVAALKSPAAPLGTNGIDERCKGKRSEIRETLAWMVDHAYVAVTPGPNRSKLHSLIKDPLEEVTKDVAEDQ